MLHGRRLSRLEDKRNEPNEPSELCFQAFGEEFEE
jgi:hypothetical protein